MTTPQTHPAITRLRELLKERHRALGSWRKLAADIREMAGTSTERQATTKTSPLDPRTLQKLCDDSEYEKVRLVVSHLPVLDRYAIAYDVAPILTPAKGLVDQVCESSRVTFFYASKFDEQEEHERQSVSRWDTRSISVLQKTNIGLLQVQLTDILQPFSWNDTARTAKTWLQVSKDAADRAIIAIGSPLVNYASLAMLCEAFALEPGAPPDVSNLPPFFIVRSGWDIGREIHNVFVRDRDDAVRMIPAAAESIGADNRAIVFNGELFTPNPDASGDKTIGHNYGLIVAYRTAPDKPIRVILSGLVGATTFGLARMLYEERQTRFLPDDRNPESQPVLARLYGFNIERPSQGAATGPELKSWYPASDPILFRRINDQWVGSKLDTDGSADKDKSAN